MVIVGKKIILNHVLQHIQDQLLAPPVVHFILDLLVPDYLAKMVDIINLRHSDVLDMMDTVFRSSGALIIFEVVRLTNDLKDGVLCWADPEIQGQVVGSQGLITGLINGDKEIGHVLDIPRATGGGDQERVE